MATDPARDGLAAALAPVVDTSEDVPRFRDAIRPFVESEIAAARRRAFTEAADAVQAERMPDPPTEEMRSRVDYWRGYDAAIFDAGEAVRGLSEETENA